MGIGRFYAAIAALLWSPANRKYLLLKRSEDRDVGGGAWECVTGRVDQGESFEDAVHREAREELGARVQIEFIVGTAHSYRGEKRPENEMLEVVYFCLIDNPETISISAEHSEYRWVTAEEAYDLLSASEPEQWIRGIIERAETIRRLLPSELLEFYRERGTQAE
jgi:8-oxo-dGTP diphosphatase